MVINLFGCQGLFLRVMSDSNKKQCKKSNKNGFTLVEVMISVVVFAVLSIVLGVILNVGLKSWKEVNARTESERDLNRAVNDINFSIKNSMLDDITCDSVNTTYRGNGYIICPSFASYKTASGKYTILENEFDFDISSYSTDEGIAFENNLKHNFWVAYCVLRDVNCPLCASMFGSTTNEDGSTSINYAGVCPHRYLIKKWYKSNNLEESVNISNIAVWNESSSDISTLLNTDFSSYLSSSKTSYDKVLSKNILAFSANKSSYGVLYYIKIFKQNVNQLKISEEKISLSINSFYNDVKGIASTEQDPLKNYCLEVHSKVIPLNK